MRNFTLYVSVRLWLAASSLGQRLLAPIVALLGTITLPAHADDGFFGMLDNVAEGADNSGKSLQKLAKFGGIGLVITGIVLWVAKKKNPQIGWGWVLTCIGAGCFLVVIDQIIKKGHNTLDLNPVDVG
ncbi:hypothetical protein CIG19_20260 [Enterobacterales bacterium CwR94]|nr:hypothetical protein CIG19_20260 [Enterobacterales bacterium CwR94]